MSELPPILNEPEEDKPPVLQPAKSDSMFNLNTAVSLKNPVVWVIIVITGVFAVGFVLEYEKELGPFFEDEAADNSPSIKLAIASPPQPPPPNLNEPPAELLSRAQSGDIAAQIELGKFFASLGWGHEGKAKRWMLKAANQGHAGAQYELGKKYLNVEFDNLGPDEVAHLTHMFTNRNPYSGFNLSEGISTRYFWEHKRASRALAAEWFHKAADQNHIEALFELGQLEPDKQTQWFRQAANLGHAPAQHRLAVLLSTGEEGKNDPAQAIEWWRKAARGGNGDAQYMLGTLHRYGKLVKQDPVTAHAWLKLATKNKHTVAAQSLKALETELTPAQIAKSAELAPGLIAAPQ